MLWSFVNIWFWQKKMAWELFHFQNKRWLTVCVPNNFRKSTTPRTFIISKIVGALKKRVVMALDVLKMAGSDWRWFPWRQRQHKVTSTASSDGSHEPKHSCSTARAFSFSIHKVWYSSNNHKWASTRNSGIYRIGEQRWLNTIQYKYNTIILLFHLISYETFTKYFHKHVQHKHKEWYII